MRFGRRCLFALLSTWILAGAPVWALDLDEVKQRGRLRVVAVNEGPGALFIGPDTGGARGFDREILEGFARAQGLKLEIVLVPSWDQLVPSLLAGKGDLVAGRVTATQERRKALDFTAEVFPTRTVVVTRKPTPPVVKREELLAAPKVATVRGTAMVDALLAAGVPPARIDDSFGPGALGEALRSKKATVVAWAVESVMIELQKDPSLELGLFLAPPESLAYGVPKGNAQLLKALNDHIGAVRSSGTWNRLVIHYFGEAAPRILGAVREQN